MEKKMKLFFQDSQQYLTKTKTHGQVAGQDSNFIIKHSTGSFKDHYYFMREIYTVT